MGRLDSDLAASIIGGIGDGCRQAGCALIGGDKPRKCPVSIRKTSTTWPGSPWGAVDNSKIVDGSETRVGHKLIGLAASGLHSKRIFSGAKDLLRRAEPAAGGRDSAAGKDPGRGASHPPPASMPKPLRHLLREFPIHGLAHITGGGIPDNIVRIIPKACSVVIYKDSWEVPPIFDFLRRGAANVPAAEMMRTFNNGIGMVAVVPNGAVEEILERLGRHEGKSLRHRRDRGAEKGVSGVSQWG